MRIKVGDRILIVFFALLIIALLVALLGCAIGYLPQITAAAAVDILYSGMTAKLIIIGCCLLLLIGCCRLIIAACGSDKPKAPASVVVDSTDTGVTTVSLAAIDNMVQRHCRANGQIKECATVIRCTEGGISLNLGLTLLPDANIPELTGALRDSLKSFIEAGSGVTVSDIGIAVSAMTSRQTMKNETVK